MAMMRIEGDIRSGKPSGYPPVPGVRDGKNSLGDGPQLWNCLSHTVAALHVLEEDLLIFEAAGIAHLFWCHNVADVMHPGQ